jgi:hypothetical protein
VRAELASGDLVLIKANTNDHLARLFLAREVDVTCWRNECRRSIDCRSCRLLTRATGT